MSVTLSSTESTYMHSYMALCMCRRGGDIVGMYTCMNVCIACVLCI